jgi:hypothetical protein
MKKAKLAVTLTSSAILAVQVFPQGQPAAPAADIAAMGKGELKIQLAATNQETTAQAGDEAELFAACYSPFEVTPLQTEYVCPHCGERTTYVAPGYVERRKGKVAPPDIDECRRLFARIPATAGMKLDESQYCRKCSPRVKNPAPVVLVPTPRGGIRRVRHVTAEELRQLGDYFTATPAEQAQALKDSRRLRKLLGK